MKRLLAVLICASILFGCCACNAVPNGANETTAVERTDEVTESATPDATETPTTGSAETEAPEELDSTTDAEIPSESDDELASTTPGSAETPTTDRDETDAPDEETDSTEPSDTYRNPIFKVGDKYTWQSYGVGDPFVMRYNGRYYLYCSTKDGMVGIKCWVSDDLVNWTYSGLCANEALTRSAYAPEVVYYNGSFYMYTSPAGNGHYVLKSDSPTGPFVAVTGNFGLSIDGNVFIDDDGSWYFYTAASDGIMAYKMSAPDKVNAASGVKIPCDLHGWTEGSMIVKHNGVYYMTYTGNHVWTSGYRINYAISETTPTQFEMVDNNPLLLSTNKKTVMGIGHSSTVLGPNLDEYYIVYHSFETAPMRNTNIDRIVFNGTATVVLGATTSAQQLPAMPDLYARFDSEDKLTEWNVTNGNLDGDAFVLREGGKVLSKQSFQGNYTAEINLLSISGSSGIMFDYLDENNYAKAVYCAETGVLMVITVVNGEETCTEALIGASFSDRLNADALIVFTVRKSEGRYTIFVNQREVYSAESVLSGGAIGVICESSTVSLGFVGVTGGAMQSTLADVHKPIENTVPAFTCTNDDKKIETCERTDYLVVADGEAYDYLVNVTDEGLYDIVIEYRSSETCIMEILQNGESIGEATLAASDGALARIAGRGMTLAAGRSTVELRVKEGSASLLGFYFHKAEIVVETTYDFETSMRYSYREARGSLKTAVWC